MFGNLGNMASMLKSVKDFQSNMAKLQQELAQRRHDGDAGGGLVRAVVDGTGTLVDVKIDRSALDDVELLEDLVKGAVSAAVTKSREAMQQEVSALTGGMVPPGMLDMLGMK